MTGLVLRLEKQVDPSEVSALLDSVSRVHSPWWVDYPALMSANGGNPTWRIRFDRPEDAEGEGKGVRIVTSQQILDALVRARTRCCCWDAMLESGLGYACAEDADQVLQELIFNREVYA